jgi:hypothetical protein
MPSESPRDSGAEVDRLYQLPLDQFVEARNALSRRVGRGEAPAIRALPKPSVLAWALNQLFWSKREVFDRLVAAAARLRGTQAQALLGKAADLRGAGEHHREALRAALRAATAVLEEGGHAVTPDAVRELTGALEALPWKEPAGRLARPPAASGFDLLAGLPLAAPAERPPVPSVKPPAEQARRAPARRDEARDAAVKAARAAAASAQRDEAAAASRLREAEKRLEAARQGERDARAALTQAEGQRAHAEAEHRAAAEAHDAAHRTAADAARSLDALDRT